MKSTSSEEVSIQAVSPLLSVGDHLATASGAASVGLLGEGRRRPPGASASQGSLLSSLMSWFLA